MEQIIKVNDIKIFYRTLVKRKGSKKLTHLLGKRRSNFCALQGISFDITPGEILGIIGTNGSGKSTLLKALGGIIKPDSGSIEVAENTRVSLLALASSLMTEMPGRDNIYLIGLQLGFSREEIEAQFNKIVEFADLGSFIDKPVRTYSSGMRSKLSFSIAVHLTTEVILIDEVLSVGDVAFRQKSYQKMKELITDDKHTVIIVSHDMGRLSTLCDRVLWLDKGQLVMLGEAKEVVSKYQQKYAATEQKGIQSEIKAPRPIEVIPSQNGLVVCWNTVSEATGYIVYRKKEKESYKRVGIVVGTQTDKFEDNNVSPGETYTYTIRAFRVYNGITDRSSVFAAGISGTVPQKNSN
ncbi:MAG: ATP-binding cassette domain-containing protein [Clostridia bacterium]|nr:ATP-binding cassette domain-containing protein [Clostridia bacterium]